MTKLTDAELAAIRERASKSTKGPWTVIPPVPYDGEDEDTQGAYVDPGGVEDADGNPVCAFGDPGGSGHLYEHPDNPAFIAATRQDVPALLDHIDALTAELSQAQASLDVVRRQMTDAQQALDAAGAPAVDGGGYLDLAGRIAALRIAALRAGAPDGWKLVPVKPTGQMMDAGREAYAAVWVPEKGGTSSSCLKLAYRAMLATAPQPPAQAVAVRVKPLVWEGKAAYTDFGTYAYREGLYWRPMRGHSYPVYLNDGKKGEDAELAAKSAAEADYTSRSLSAIDARPVGAVKAEALREVSGKINAAADDVYSNTGNPDATVGYQNAASMCMAEADRLEREGA